MRQRFARARDRMTDGPRDTRALTCSAPPRPISCASTSRRRGSRSTTKLCHGGGRTGRGRGGALVRLRRAGSAAAPRAPVLRQEGRDDRRRCRRDGESQGDARMSPAEEADEMLDLAGDRERRQARQLLADRRQADRPGDVGDPDRPARAPPRRSSAWRSVPGASPRRAGAAARRRAARGEAGARQADHAGSGQDPPGEPRRSPGDDRHLRLRGRPVAPALRPHHCQRAVRTTG